MIQLTLTKADGIGYQVIYVNLLAVTEQSKWETYDTYDRALERYKELAKEL